MKKVLVLGGTGAMGVYLVPELRAMGYAVDVTTLDTVDSADPMLRYITADTMRDEVLFPLLDNGYDAIVDFMIYFEPDKSFRPRMDKLLHSTKHYIHLSTYRIYADLEHPVRETSPRLLDAARDGRISVHPQFLAHTPHEYSLYKAVGEDMLQGSGCRNWTVVRPAITYSQRRFQLVTLEADLVVARMQAGKTVLLPEGAMEHQATMSWAGDVGRLLARLVLNPGAYGERFTVSTAEHHTWREVAEIYREIGGLRYQVVDNDTFLSVCTPNSLMNRWQLELDRCYDRIMDNTKVLTVTGMKQSQLMPLKEGLKRELAGLPAGFVWPDNPINSKMDAYLAKKGI